MGKTESPAAESLRFDQLNLPKPLLDGLIAVGYENPSPIQAETIPPLLAGRDVLGQAQTGTGKTAAFALPVLARLKPGQRLPQALVLCPTRELAIQVAEAFQKYASKLPDFHVLPIYGGQAYGQQLQGLRRGVDVVVGTPGRVIDHLERGTLDLSQLTTLVLDEADEMLRMGFIDDVKSILDKTPPTRQIALFSATMPAPIKKIADTYLKNPVEVAIAAATRTATTVKQRYWMGSPAQKLEALTRILEVEPFEGMIVFARTKQSTEELAEKLAARGFSAQAINGDIAQALREKTIAKLKDGSLDILVATDVAARGLDVDRISHVVNYDVPYDVESYVHRIGRTGRAGRSGEAILFVAPRERGMLRTIERVTRQVITPMDLPTVDDINQSRVAKFKTRIGEALAQGGLEVFLELIEEYEKEHGTSTVEIAAALARMAQGDTPLLVKPDRKSEAFGNSRAYEDRPERSGPRRSFEDRPERSGPPKRFERPERSSERPVRRGDDDRRPAPRRDAPVESAAPPRKPRIERFDDAAAAPAAPRAPREEFADRPRPPRRDSRADEGLETYRIAVGREQGAMPRNIIGAIANEAGLESRHIGKLEIHDSYSLIDLPSGMPPDVFNHLKKVWVSGKTLDIRKYDDDAPAPARTAGKPPRGPRKG
ncbi:MAG: DEAD/DEAH box helicase [Ahniella sp.]|nr:DEAD/DEAH box helicase [Ahniella sp.]